jgi:hypothetical protein
MKNFFKVIVLFLYFTQKSNSENECQLRSVHIVRNLFKNLFEKYF